MEYPVAHGYTKCFTVHKLIAKTWYSWSLAGLCETIEYVAIYGETLRLFIL